ncbi:MAG: divergent PAP2 family protein [Spirochaetes bacterium]|nr:divergent PAP2 family protein [Spirochaetota bacterium]MBU1082152.1 divergent PAP2 family protein [Spirochaetota bacterium]
MEQHRALALAAILRNDVFLSAAMSLFMAQFAKALIVLLTNRKAGIREIFSTLLWKTGGMPSSHSALVISITTSIGFSSGLSSDVFALSFFFALVVIRDAMGVRRAAGMQAKALNSLGMRISKRFHIPFKTVKEIHGHTFPQVVAGSLMGFFIALAVSTL